MRMIFLILFLFLLLLCGYVIYAPYNFIDTHILGIVQQIQTKALIHVAIELAKIGSLLFTVIFVLFFVVYSVVARNWFGVYLGILGLISTASTVWLMKWIFARPRPFSETQIVATYGSSFPSAHSAYAAMLACLLVMTFASQRPCNSWVWGVAILWAVMMGWSRVYLGVHFPTDVFAGWIIAILVMFLVKSGLNKFYIKQQYSEKYCD